jgi:hypothetical protein
MSKFILAFLLMIVSVAHAEKMVEADKPILCFDTKSFLKQIKNKYGEEPMIIGKTAGVKDVATAFYINRDTGSFTVVEIDAEAACVISTGTEARYRLPKSSLNL